MSQSTDTFLVVNAPDTILLRATSPEGCFTELKIPVKSDSQLRPNINELSLCDNNLGTLDAGTGFDRYLWSTGATTQVITTNQPGLFWVEVSQSTCQGRDTVVVLNSATPSFSLNKNPITVCRTDEGFGPYSVDFNSVVQPAGVQGLWSELTSSGVDLSGTLSAVSFLGVPAGTYRFVFSTTGAVLPCDNQSDTLTIHVNACQCPEILPTGPFCNAGSAPVDMKTKKGNPSLGGTFSVINPSGITMNNGIFNPAGLTAGMYTIEWALTAQCKPVIEVEVYNKPNAQLTTQQFTLCNDNASGNSTILDLSSLLQNGTSSGDWRLVSGTAGAFKAPSTVDGKGLQKGEKLLLRYITNSAQQPCGEDSIDLEVVIRDCRCPEVIIAPLTLCNGDNSSIDLNASTILTTNPAGVSGVWSSSVVGAVTQNRYLSPLGIPSGQHTITYTLTTTVSGCQDKFTQNIAISLQPVAESAGPATACNVSSGNGPTTLRLNDLLKPGFSASGVWTQSSGMPALPISNGQVNFAGQPVGSVFKFTYTRTATAPCTPVSAEVEVTVKSCECPPILIRQPDPICNESGILNLSSLELPGNSPGNWQVKTPSGNSLAVSNKLLDAKGLPEGNYTLTYVLSPSPQGNCPKDSLVVLRVVKQNNATLKDTTVCNTASGSGPSVLDLRNLVLTTTGSGKWVDEDGTDVPNITNVSFVGKPLGTLTLYYVLPSAAPCVDRRIPVQIEVVDCSCDQIDLGQIPSICTDKASFDLKPYSDPRPGIWVSSQSGVLIQNGILSLTGLPAGAYEVTYQLATPPPAPCPADKKTLINIFNPKSAGTVSGARYCAGTTDVVNLFERLDGEAPGGTWTFVSGGSAGFSAANATFQLAGRPAGTYVFRYTISGQAPCADDSEDVTIQIYPQPVADAGPDKTLDCQVKSVILGTSQSTSGSTIVYEWKRGNDLLGNARTISVTEGGIYNFVVKDTATTCASTDEVVVAQNAGLPVFEVSLDPIACFGQTATLRISKITGGQAPYQLSLDGGKSWLPVQGNATILNGLKKGQYILWLKDANGCINDAWPPFTLNEPPLLTVNLGPDMTINLGQDTLIVLALNPTATSIASVKWFADGKELTSEQGKTSLVVTPSESTTYSVTVTSQSGCVASDAVVVSLRRVKPECVPNIITPDKPGGNQYFSIHCEEVELVTRYSIYDRWGNLVFSAKNLSPTQPSSFWDGRLSGQGVVPGVYVYTLEMLFKDGSTETRTGDVTVVK
ncbi:MAG: gliding motility-associated C-terminal domain-containing protein, partial [Saprospiraceae bacterium]|nr:gliding motility-associated C-terminal domain-containing protein [Saprospiraceae bacterium]